MKVTIIAGLGNPGPQYQITRHNLGFIAIDAFAERHNGSWRESKRFNVAYARVVINDTALLLVKPLTYMNHSGSALAALCSYYSVAVEALTVVYDEINLELGRAKISLSGSAGGHNGIADILARVGNGFTRYRLGIGPKTPAFISLNHFVLGSFTQEQLTLVQECIPFWLDGLEVIVRQGAVAAMNVFNRRAK